MNLPDDPHVLLSYINTLLRNRNKTLESLCEEFDIPLNEIMSRLLAIGYVYNAQARQFQLK